jgi:hypothetical protein
MSQISPVVLMARRCPILHLNRYKISSPTFYATMSDTELDAYFRGCGWSPRTVDVRHDEDPDAATGKELDAARAELRSPEGPPMIILRSAKGAGAPETDPHGTPLAGTFHAHQVPLPHAADDPEELKLFGKWLRSYRPEELLFDESGASVRRSADRPGPYPPAGSAGYLSRPAGCFAGNSRSPGSTTSPWLGPDAARAHCAGWSGVWQWASTDGHRFPDIVFACAGTTPTVDTLPPYGCPSSASRQRFGRLGVEQQYRGGTLPYLGPYFAAKAAMDALAVSYVAALAIGIETSIIVPGAFTTGTNRFAHGGHPADQAIVEAYEQQYAGLMEQVSQRLAALAPADADVPAVSDAINTVVDARKALGRSEPTSIPPTTARKKWPPSPTGSASSSSNASGWTTFSTVPHASGTFQRRSHV